MAISWYLRLFYIPILNLGISIFLSRLIKAKRMPREGPSKGWSIFGLIEFVGMCILMWFVSFSVDLTFWIGICIIILGQIVFGLGYASMREFPEQKKAVVDWGIYKISRHPHLIAGMITNLGTIIIGWNMESTAYFILWLFFIFSIAMTHFAILREEKMNVKKFGQEYRDYMQIVPRYF